MLWTWIKVSLLFIYLFIHLYGETIFKNRSCHHHHHHLILLLLLLLIVNCDICIGEKKKGFGWYKKTIEETLNWNQNKSLVYVVVVVVIVELLLYTYCQRNDDEFYELLQNL